MGSKHKEKHEKCIDIKPVSKYTTLVCTRMHIFFRVQCITASNLVIITRGCPDIYQY